MYIVQLYILCIKVVPCPALSTSSAGGGFNLWSFMTAGVVAATVVGNIVDNVNDNNNNNNNNNNQDNQNSNNMNINNNDNMNMNDNMLNMAMGRGLFEEWVREGTSKGMTKEMENAKKYNESENEHHDLSTHDGLTFLFKLVCKVLTSWMKVSDGPVESKPLRDVLVKKCILWGIAE